MKQIFKLEQPMKPITAIAHPNIALIKYWGKRNSQLNLPAVGSISLTLSNLYTRSSIKFLEQDTEDRLILNGTIATLKERKRVTSFMDIFRKLANNPTQVEITSDNNFPTGAGLASSASAFASLAVAANEAFGLSLSQTRLSELARMGSGSAARSIYGGFVEMKMGLCADGSDAIAIQLAPENYWDIRLLIVITDTEAKEIGSTVGMQRSAETSPYYAAWVQTSQADLKDMRSAIQQKDFIKLGELAEHNCLKMHSLTMTSRPPFYYWNHATFALMKQVSELRKKGLSAFFTIDAGPQVKILCLPDDSIKIQMELKHISGIQHIIETAPGIRARIVE